MCLRNKLILFFAMMMASIFMIAPTWGAEAAPLALDQAFQVSAHVKNQNTILVEWQVAPNYYLYANKTKINLDPAVPAVISYPKGVVQKNTTLGKYTAYDGKFTIPVVLELNAEKVNVTVSYQGCSHGGFCYPPSTKTFSFTMPPTLPVATTAPSAASMSTLMTSQQQVSSLFHTKSLGMLVLVFLGLGLLLAFTPCVLPMIPILTGIILGQQHAVGTRKAFFLSLTYVMGMAITYSIAGLIAATLGSSIQAWLQQPLIIAAASLLFIVLGFSLFGFYDLRISHRIQNKVFQWSDQHERGTYVGVFFMGVLSTLVVSPCVTAPLIGVLIYIGQTGNLVLGASALFAMGIGMGLPLIAIGMSAGKWLPKSGPWMKTIKATFGILMMAMAVWLLARILPTMVTQLLWGTFVIGIAFFLGFYVPHHIGQYRFNRGLGVVIGFFGVIMLLGGMGISTALDQWVGEKIGVVTASHFTVVHNLAEFNEQLAIAKDEKRPVILDFYANWCESCVVMEKKVFRNRNVKQELTNYVLLRADLTQNTEDDQAMLKYFNVIAPPTVLFFNLNGKEASDERVVGEVDAKQFMNRLNIFMASSCAKTIDC